MFLNLSISGCVNANLFNIASFISFSFASFFLRSASSSFLRSAASSAAFASASSFSLRSFSRRSFSLRASSARRFCSFAASIAVFTSVFIFLIFNLYIEYVCPYLLEGGIVLIVSFVSIKLFS